MGMRLVDVPFDLNVALKNRDGVSPAGAQGVAVWTMLDRAQLIPVHDDVNTYVQKYMKMKLYLML